MSEQSKAWASEFGNAYLIRNRVDWRQRIPFWQKIMELTDARSVLEVGCNAGWNLSAIQQVAPHVKTWGVDVNHAALTEAHAAGMDVALVEGISDLPQVLAAWRIQRGCDLVFTAGVLIHVPDEEVEQSMKAIINASTCYVLAVEYEAAVSQEIPYRGEPKRLWKRPYGALYQSLGLSLVERGYLNRRTGFDDCTYWLLRKQ